MVKIGNVFKYKCFRLPNNAPVEQLFPQSKNRTYKEKNQITLNSFNVTSEFKQ